MKHLGAKLRSNAGESLVETLCAIAIFALASVALYTMLMTSGSINRDARERDRNIREQLVIVEKAEGAAEAGTVTVSVTDSRGNTRSFGIEVEVYRTEDLFSYFRAKGSAQ